MTFKLQLILPLVVHAMPIQSALSYSDQCDPYSSGCSNEVAVQIEIQISIYWNPRGNFPITIGGGQGCPCMKKNSRVVYLKFCHSSSSSRGCGVVVIEEKGQSVQY